MATDATGTSLYARLVAVLDWSADNPGDPGAEDRLFARVTEACALYRQETSKATVFADRAPASTSGRSRAPVHACTRARSTEVAP